MPEQLRKAVCIPAFNEERSIGSIITRSRKYVDRVLVCDDGSTDRTAEVAESLGAEVLRHQRNMGKGEALRTLFEACRQIDVDMMVTLDGDDQHDADDIPRVLDPIEKGYADIVIGARFHENNKGIPSYRKVGNRLLNAVTIEGVSDTQSGFRAYNRRAIENIYPAEMGMGADSEILADAASKGFKLIEVPIAVRYGIGDTSTHHPVYHTMDVLTSALKLTSIRHPMLFYGIPGLGISAIGLVFILRAYLLVLHEQIITNIVITYALVGFSVAMFGLFTFFTGIILFTLSTVLRKGAS